MSSSTKISHYKKQFPQKTDRYELLIRNGVLEQHHLKISTNGADYTITTFPTNTRQWRLFKTANSNPVTLGNYVKNLKTFFLWCWKHNYYIQGLPELAEIKKEKLSIILEDYIMDLIENVKPTTIRAYMAGVESFLDINDVFYSKKKLHKLCPKRNKPAGSNAYTIEMIRLMLKNVKSLRTKSIILLLASSGMRVGGLPNLKIKHLHKMENCYTINVYADDDLVGVDYWTFCTPETRTMLDMYFNLRKSQGEQITKDSYVLANKSDVLKPVNEGLIRDRIRCVLDAITASDGNLRDKVTAMRYNISIVHGFRRFFKTSLVETKYEFDGKTVPAISEQEQEKMMGHANGMKGTYYDATPDMLFPEYKKAIDQLTISLEESQKIKIMKMSSDQEKLEKNMLEEQSVMKKKIEQLSQEQSALNYFCENYIRQTQEI